MKNKMISFFIFFFSVCALQTANSANLPSRYDELLKFIVRSPYQYKTDNCLFMGTTGAVEIAVNKHFNIVNPGINGPYDLNEKWAYAGDLEEEKSWFEDPIRRFNNGAVRNDDYAYNGKYFWNGSIPDVDRVKLPTLKSNWFLTTENGDKKARFSYDVFREKDITQIKEMLLKYRSPIVIVYRTAGKDSGYGYWNTWHTAVIAGYDDNFALEESCPLTKETMRWIGSSGRSELKDAVAREGGCHSKGAFIVRDSEDPEPGESRVPEFTHKAYDDIKFLGTNAMVVYIEQR